MFNHYKKAILFITFIFICLTINAAPEINAEFSFFSNNRAIEGSNFSVKSNLKLDFRVFNHFSFILGLETDNFEIEPVELNFFFKINDYINISFGKIRNALTLEQYNNKESKNLFGTDSLISNHIIDLSYISNNLGLKVFKDYTRNSLPFSYFVQVHLVPSQVEVQLNTGFFYHFHGENSYLGVLGCYLPFIAHDIWENENPDYNSHNFIINTVLSDYSNNFKYGLELTFGSNLSTPVTLFQYPENTEFSFFIGGNLHIGYQIDFNNLEWIPMLRYCILFPELTLPEINLMEIRMGNLLRLLNKFNFYIDAGIGIDTEYYNNNLYTGFEFLWGLKFLISL